MASSQDPNFVAPSAFGDEPAPYELPPTSPKNTSPMNRRVLAALAVLAIVVVVTLLAMLTNVDQEGSPLPQPAAPGQLPR